MSAPGKMPVHRIAVFRALMLGDLLCATPALRALRAAYPSAMITLVGLPASRALADRLHSVDDFIPFPGFPGLPESEPRISALPGFLSEVQQRRYDLAIQLHGSGRIVNPLVACFGARCTAGFALSRDDAAPLSIAVPWPGRGHEIERMLAIVDALGLERRGRRLDFPLPASAHNWRDTQLPALRQHRYVCIHPGAQLPSRRWPADRFAQVARYVARLGLLVAVTGTPSERNLVQTVVDASDGRAVDLGGRTDLWQLGAIIEKAALLISNDTGLSHIAAALRTPSVIVSNGADVERWAPLDRDRHQVLWASVPCRPCSYRECPTAHECATAIGVDAVIAAVGRALETAHA